MGSMPQAGLPSLPCCTPRTVEGCTSGIFFCILQLFLGAIGRQSRLSPWLAVSHSSASLCWMISLKFIISFPFLSPIFLITHSSTFLNHSPPFFLLTPFKLAEGQCHYPSCSPPPLPPPHHAQAVSFTSFAGLSPLVPCPCYSPDTHRPQKTMR